MNKKNELLNSLEEHENIQKETIKLEKRIHKLEQQSTIISDVVQNGYKRRLIISGVDSTRLDNINRLKEILEKRYNRLLESQIKIEEFIDEIGPSDIRQILIHKYIDNMSWIKIQINMKYKHEDTARKKIERYFEKF